MFNRELAIKILEEHVVPIFSFHKGTHSDGKMGRCAIGGLLSHYGWDGKTGERWSDGIYCEDDQAWNKMREELGEQDDIGLAQMNDLARSWSELIKWLNEGRRGIFVDPGYKPGVG